MAKRSSGDPVGEDQAHGLVAGVARVALITEGEMTAGRGDGGSHSPVAWMWNPWKPGGRPRSDASAITRPPVSVKVTYPRAPP